MSRKTLGHLTYRGGRPVAGLCYCDHGLAHDAEPEDGTADAGKSFRTLPAALAGFLLENTPGNAGDDLPGLVEAAFIAGWDAAKRQKLLLA